MPGFLVDPADVRGDALALRGEEAHHLARVRRHAVGDQVQVVDGRGWAYRARIVALGTEEVVCRILERCREQGESRVRLRLAVALVKGQRFDVLVEKATEIGVASIAPLLTERGVVKPGSEHKPARWAHLARAALKQCGRSRLPELEAPAPLEQVLEQCRREGELALLAAPGAAGELRRCLEGRPVGRLTLLVGPEGGFSPAEQERAQERGAEIFSWGNRILRTETAGIALAALVLHEAEQRLDTGERGNH